MGGGYRAMAAQRDLDLWRKPAERPAGGALQQKAGFGKTEIGGQYLEMVVGEVVVRQQIHARGVAAASLRREGIDLEEREVHEAKLRRFFLEKQMHNC